MLRHIDLSNNLIDDRGVKQLSEEIGKLPNGLVTLRLSKIGMTAESKYGQGEERVTHRTLHSVDLEVWSKNINSYT